MRTSILLLAAFASIVLAACAPRGRSQAYLAACHGAPLASVEAREEAMTQGYEIHPGYGCVTKESYAAVQVHQAAGAAANTPEARAAREAEFAATAARAEEERRQHAVAGVPSPLVAPDPVELRPVDVNTATQAELAAVIGVGDEVAAQIVAARRDRRFRDWADLVARVAGLSAAQPAAVASIGGLNVNGESLSGAPPDAPMAQRIRDRRRQYETR
jgi:DNA uptake protein ComE-like DNA-binding protein